MNGRATYPGPTEGESSCHLFSWVTPNWGHCQVTGATIQELKFRLLCGDTMEKAEIESGAATQLTLVLSP